MRLPLACSVLPISARAAAAQRTGLSLAEVVDIVHHRRAWRSGAVLDEAAYDQAYPAQQRGPYPHDEFGRFTGAGLLPADLVVQEIEVPRDPRERLDPPISAADVAAADVLRIDQIVAARQGRGAPVLLQQEARAHLQAIVEVLESAGDGVDTVALTRWQPMSELAPYYFSAYLSTPRCGAQGEPATSDLYLELTEDLDAFTPVDCAVLQQGYLVQFPRTSLVLSATGEIRDAFATNGLRAVGGDRGRLLLVPGGGGADARGFLPVAYVRDLEQRRWLSGPLTDAVPRFTSGTVPGIDATVVVDLAAGTFCWTDPHLPNPAWHRTASACGHYAWGGGSFVREAATGAAVLDVRRLEGVRLEGFARTDQGWRFLLRQEPDEDDPREYRFESQYPLRLLDESGEVVRELLDHPAPHVVALSPDGTRLLHATREELHVVDADSGRSLEVVDLRPLRRSVAAIGQN
ncbi:MAG: hypothetical protein IPK24_22630 [Kineosporiaceae bacterium]|nr:hypothetical protein [Kineosporiaceae bacterium]